MQQQTKSKTSHRKTRVVRIVKWVFVSVIVLIVLLVLLLPVVASSQKCRQIILAKINRSINGKADFTDLSVGWLKGISVAGFSFADNAGQTSVAVKQISTIPHYGALLMGKLSFGKTIIDEPRVQINLKAQPPRAVTPAPSPKPAAVKIPVERIDLVVKNGSVRLTDLSAKTVEISQVNSQLALRQAGRNTSLEANMAVANGGKTAEVHTTAQLEQKGKTGWSLKNTTGSLTIEVNDLQLESLGPIFAMAGVEIEAKGSVRANIEGQIQSGQLENLIAVIKGKNLDVTGAKLKGDRLQTSVLDVDVKLKREKDMLNIDKLDVRSDWAFASAKGIVPTTLKSTGDLLKPESTYKLDGDFNCDVATILSQMPKTLGVKEGMKITSGKLVGKVSTTTESGRAVVSGQAKLDSLAGTVGEKKLAISQPIAAELKLTTDKDKTSFDKLQVSAAFANINAGGSFEQIKYDGKVDLAKLQSELGQFLSLGGYQVKGELSSNGQVSIMKDKTAVAGTASVKELQLAAADGNSVSEPKADVAFSLGVDSKSNTLNIASVQLKATLGTVDVADAVVPLGQQTAGAIKVPVSVSGLDLAKLQPFAVMFASFPKQTQLAGLADGKVLLSSEKGLYRITTDSAKVAGLKITSPGKQPFEQQQVTVILDVQIDPVQKAIDVKKLQLDSPQIKIKKGELKKVGQADKTKIQGQLECEYDWSAVSSMVSAFLPQGLKLEGHRQTTITFASEYLTKEPDKLLANLNTKAGVGFDKAQYMGLNIGSTEVNMQVENGLLKIAPFSTTLNNGKLNFAAQADFRQSPIIFRTPGKLLVAKDIQINQETTQKLLAYLNPIFADAVNVSGIASLECEKLAIPLDSAAKDRAEIVGTVELRKIRLQASDLLGQLLAVGGGSFRGEELTVHPTRFTLEKGILSYEDMQIDVGDNPINFKGAIGLDKSLNMTITLPYTVRGRTARVGQNAAAERIAVHLKGTINKPQLDVGKTIEDQLFRGLEGLLKKG